MRPCVAMLALFGGCTSGAALPPPSPLPPSRTVAADTAGLVPPGRGSLRQDDVALRLQQLGVTVRLIPLDEAVLRVLSPDSYRALRELRESRRAAIDAAARRAAVRSPSLWYVSFHNQEEGEARFTPSSLVLSNVGRDFRPLEAIPLTAGFGAQRLAQRESQSAILLFDEALDVRQPIVVLYEGSTNTEWAERVQRIERERALIRSRTAG